jgi:predicted acyltransferase
MENQFEKPARLVSLDALRGFDMLWIIGGSRVIQDFARASNLGFFNTLAEQMEHQQWNGFHFYDLIMPLFLFMVGMSIPFSLSKRLAEGTSEKQIYLHAAKRAAILFILGMVCQCRLLAFDLSKLFIIHDTLQAIAIGYLFSVIIYTRLKLKYQLALTAGLLLVYWAILQFIAVPGHEAGLLTRDSNIAKYVEQLVFGRFDDAPAPYTWFLGSLGFVATVMTGVFASTILRSKNLNFRWLKSDNILIRKTVLLIVVGLTLTIAGQLMSIWFPIIKPIWNPTFVLYSSGLSFLLMAGFYYIIDVKGYQRWAFWLKVIGMNSIAVYMGVHFIDFTQISHKLFFGLEQFMGDYYLSFKSVGRLAITYGILYYMYKKGTFIKI